MTIMKRTLGATALAAGVCSILFVGAANAADLVEPAPAPGVPMDIPPVASWGGAYAGVTAGYGFAGRARDKTADNRIDTDGFVGGGFLGYNYDTGTGIVAGVEGDVGYNGVKGDNAGTSVKGGVDGSLRARLGYTVTPDVLLYTTAGGAARRTSVSQGGVKDSQGQLGYTAGFGTDVKITQQVFGRVEYRYTDYGTDSFNTAAGSRDVSSKDNRVTLGIGVKF